MDDRQPALARLDALVGRWTVQPKVAGLGSAWVEFAWQDGGLFLRQESHMDDWPPTAPQEWRDHSPFPTTAVIGLDGDADAYTMLYADARGVHRVYRMTFAGGEWAMWREAPGFNQRFTARASADGDRFDGRWEMSADGVTWHVDFEVSYTRHR